MHKNTIWYGAVLLVVYFTLVFCEETKNEEPPAELDNQAEDTWENLGRELIEFEGRTRRHRHHMWYRHLWPIAIAYWIKVKVVIVSFFVGSAIYLGLRYFWPHARCNQEIILDHPPSSFSHHDHIPYSLDHDHSDHYDSPTSFDSGASFEPYSGYSSYAGSDIVSDVHGDYHGDSPSGPGPTGPVDTRRRGRRSTKDQAHLIQDDEQQQEEQVEIVDEEISESVARQMPAEEQIADFMFAFLGLDSKACRRRFVCEMEFRSKLNPMTSMAFRIVGRGFFEKYTNARNPEARATNFGECAAVNPECIFVENDNPEEIPETETHQEEQQQEEQAATEESAVEDSENEINLQAERRHAKHKNRKLSSVAEHILTQ
ncbi:uncharacterized protein LOC119550516 [Drosophila subpulchrella]|uniref:uncharacterized protein LOC119550516 n=1 Tax=Drosophila subpulchrella TaxID=1486046 RepID=UPI0018A157DB|nr:uncharacterized protein LOC119550516 [Drosophila subpulchrella]